MWRAISEDDELAAWFPARIVGTREPGADLRFIFPPKPGQVPADSAEAGATMTGKMLVFDPPRVLEYLWDADVLRFELEPRLNGLTRQPFTAERHEALFARYAERFGPAGAALKSPDK